MAGAPSLTALVPKSIFILPEMTETSFPLSNPTLSLVLNPAHLRLQFTDFANANPVLTQISASP